jgi:hypothetical protein
VKVIDFSNVYVPNAFTPNNDGRNDVLKVKVYGKIILDGFTIYNRWGQPIFFTTDVNQVGMVLKKGLPCLALLTLGSCRDMISMGHPLG